MSVEETAALDVALGTAAETIPLLVAGVRSAAVYIHDPRKAITFDVPRVTGSVVSSDIWPDPEMRQVWLTTQACVRAAHYHLGKACGHLSGWRFRSSGRPVAERVLVQGLQDMLASLQELVAQARLETLTEHQRKHAGHAVHAVFHAYRAMPRGLHSPVTQPTPVRRCDDRCGRPAAEKRRHCWTCITRRQRQRRGTSAQRVH